MKAVANDKRQSGYIRLPSSGYCLRASSNINLGQALGAPKDKP
jgi:hypothetical protein